MSAGARVVLDYAGLAIEARCSDPADLVWLREFLCPWFEPVERDVPDRLAELTSDDAAFAAAYSSGRPGDRRAAFLGDGTPLEVVSWGGAAHEPLHLDASSQVLLAVDAPRARCRLLARRGRRFARVVWMRAVREFATDALLRAGRPFLHAAAVAVSGRAIAFAGRKAAGKTSCLLHALQASGAALLANDRVALLPGSAAPRARGMPTIVRLRAGALGRYPELERRALAADPHASDAVGEDPAGQPTWPRPSGSRGLSPAQLLALLAVPPAAEAPLAAVVLPQITHEPGGFRIERLSEDRAARELADAFLDFRVPPGGTLFSAPGATPGDPAWYAQPLAREVPCLSLRLGLDAFRGDPAQLLKELGAACT